VSFIGVFTNVGLDRCRDAANNLGFKIVATSFKVSNLATPGGAPALRLLTTANFGQFYSGLVSSAVLVGDSTVQVSGSIPPGATLGQESVNEIYVFAKDSNNVDFLLAVGQPQVGSNILYDPSGETTLRLQLKLSNADLTSFLTFSFTQATELSEHNQDPNAHPDIRDLLEKAGLFAQPAQHGFIGQSFDEFAQFHVSVQEDDLVYKDTDGFYKRAVKDNTPKERVAGIAKIARGMVVADGLVKKTHGYPALTRLYLHPSNPGQVTDVPSGIPVGLSFGINTLALRVDEPQDIFDQADAVVSNLPGFKHFSDAQEAIDSVPDGGTVRFDIDYPVRGPNPLNNDGKVVNFLFTGTKSGVHKFGGINEIQLLTFDAVPDAGDFVLVHDSNPTTRLAYNANAAAIEAALEALPSIQNVTVTGNATIGFTIEFVGVDGLQDQPLVAPGAYPGNNEIQKLSFDSTDFDSGTFKLNFNSQLTAAIAFNNINTTSIKNALEALSTVDTVTVTAVGSPPPGTTEFLIEFTGDEGLSDQPLIVAPLIDNSLQDSSAQPINITISESTAGVLPDNLLFSASVPVAINTATTQAGESPGTATAFELDAPGCQFFGLGRIYNFTTGINLNLQENTRIEMFFENTANPLNTSGLTLDQYNTDGSLGLPSSLSSETAFRDLAKVKAQPIADKTTIVTPAVATLLDGSQQGLSVGRNPTDFSGATINWETGVVIGGDSFTPFSPLSPTSYYKYAVIIRLDGQLGVISPAGEGISASLAPNPVVKNGILRGIVTLHGDGLGGIDNVTPAAIRNFYDTGAINFDQEEIEITAMSGGQTVFDISTYTSLTFDPSNTVLDLDVRIGGAYQHQDQTGGLNEDFRKISNTEIEFSSTIPEDNKVFIRIKTSDTHLISTGSQFEAKVWKFTTDGINSEFDLSAQSANWNPSNSIYDIEVLLAGQEQLQDSTGTYLEDFIKTSNTAFEFSKDGIAFVPPAGIKVWVRSRLFQLGTSLDTGVTSQDEGSPLASKASTYNFVGTNIEVTQVAPGQHQVTAISSEGQNVGAGEGSVFKQRSGLNFQFRKIRGGPGIFVLQDGDDIVISLADSSYFRQFRSNLSGTLITSAGLYDLGTGKLTAYRNGLRLINTNSVGDAIDQYQEDASRVKISLALTANLADWFGFFHSDTQPAWTQLYDGASYIGVSVLTTPSYLMASDRLRVFRNGLLLNTDGNGPATARYSETSTTSITLDSPLSATDWISIDYEGLAPLFKEEVMGFAGLTMNLANQYTVGSNRLFVYRNGLLLNDVAMSSAVTQYTESGTFGNPSQVITLGSNASILDYFTVIAKA